MIIDHNAMLHQTLHRRSIPDENPSVSHRAPILETCFGEENAVKKYTASVPHRRRQTINYKMGAEGRWEFLFYFFLKAVYDERVGSQLKECNPLAG